MIKGDYYKISNGYMYPESYDTILDNGIVSMDPWRLIGGDELEDRYSGMIDRYGYKYIPFARRDDRDDVACFLIGKEYVVIVHDFASKGAELVSEVGTIWDWLLVAVNDMIEFHA